MRYFISFASFFVFSFSFFAHANFLDYDQIPDWAVSAVEGLVNKEIISGNDDGTFAPDRPMNRAEFCKLIVNATGVTKYLPLTSHFPDIERSDWFFDFIETAQEYGWVSGYPDGFFRPAGKINRAEAAKILSIAFGLQVPAVQPGEIWSDPYFNALDATNLLPHGVSRSEINPSHTPSRSEIVDQVYRFMKYTGKWSPYDMQTQNEKENESFFSEQNFSDETQELVKESEENQEEESIDDVINNDDEEKIEENSFKNSVYEYEKSIKSSFAYRDDAGDLYIENSPDLPQKKTVNRAAKAVLVHDFSLFTKGGPVTIGGFSFRRMGSGNPVHFYRAWLEMDGKSISEKVPVLSDFFFIPLQEDIVLTTTKKNIQLRVDMGYVSSNDKTSRFVLYRPDWIDADTAIKIGLFPLGGTDISMK